MVWVEQSNLTKSEENFMSYLRLVNCHIRGLFPEKTNRDIDWEKAGFDVVNVSRLSAQGRISELNDDYVSVLPLNDEVKFNVCKCFKGNRVILDEVNENIHVRDVASVITDAAAEVIKADIQAYRETQAAI